MIKISSLYQRGARFSKVSQLFGHISGGIILFYLQREGVSRQETLQLFQYLFRLEHMKRTALQNDGVAVLRMAFWARKVLGDFLEMSPRCKRSYLYGPLCAAGFSKGTTPCFSFYLSGLNSRKGEKICQKGSWSDCYLNCGVLYTS